MLTIADKRGKLRLVVSPDGQDGSVSIHQDARLYAGMFDDGESAELAIATGRLAYVHLARGKLSVNGHTLQAGDGALLENETQLVIENAHAAEVLVFDLAPKP